MCLEQILCFQCAGGRVLPQAFCFEQSESHITGSVELARAVARDGGGAMPQVYGENTACKDRLANQGEYPANGLYVEGADDKELDSA